MADLYEILVFAYLFGALFGALFGHLLMVKTGTFVAVNFERWEFRSEYG